MTIKKFEDLDCWKEARSLVNSIYLLSRTANFSRDLRLVGQITGAGISVMNNIAEGFDSRLNKEFIRFLRISRRSASEVQNCLYIALDQEYISDKDFEEVYAHAESVRRIIDGFIRYLTGVKKTV